MLFGIVAVAAGVTLLVCWLTGSVLGIVISVLVLGYLASLLIAPKRPCRSCHGRRQHPDPLRSGGNRRCWTCHGNGEQVRWGTALLRPGVRKQIRDGQHGRNY